MLTTLKIYVYPDISNASSPFANVFLPQKKYFGNYHSEHFFKRAVLSSPLLVSNPEKSLFAFMPFSGNALRSDRRVRSEGKIAEFVASYVARLSREAGSWNRSGGAAHFFVSCHSAARDAAGRVPALRVNGVHVGCSSGYFQRSFVAHRDVSLPQIWPRPLERRLRPVRSRTRLAFFSGRIQNSQVRRELIAQWGNDSAMDIFSGNPPFPYEEGFRRSRFCLHVKGYEVNTARISDAIHFGCIPVILSNYYDLPFASVLDWNKFSFIFNHRDMPLLKKALLSVTDEDYLAMYNNLLQIRKHFVWHVPPKEYDAFYMTAHQLWTRRMTYLGHGS